MHVLHDPRSVNVLHTFLSGKHDSKEWFNLKTQADQLRLTRGFDRLISLDVLDIDLYEHQQEAVLCVLRQMRGRAVLADEVGLGKTIEAGVICKEYLLRGLICRVLILVPASLVTQWKTEMAEKIGLDLAVARQPGAFRKHNLVLASLDTAKRADNAAVIHATHWDMVVVDEAHRLKNKTTVNWSFVNAIEKKFLLLLTATPVQNDLRELYNLITLLQPGQLRTYSQFKKEFMLDRHSPKNTGHLRELLAEVMVRKCRRETLIRFPHREVRSLSVPLQGVEAHFYQSMLTALGEAYRAQPAKKRNLLPFLLLLRETCSHPLAACRTMQAMANKVGKGVIKQSVLHHLLTLCPQEKPAKLRLAMDFLQKIDERAIVFTEFKTTQKAIMAACKEASVTAQAFYGGLTPGEKEEVINKFRRRGGVLVSTECGSEGRNLQFCRTMVNYDLPWNPMRLEQRIGRIHRLGQTSDVLIINLVTEGTVEAYLLYLLERKINMFQKVIGEIEAVMATLPAPYERILAHLVLDSESEAQMVERFTAFGNELAQACETYERVRRLNHQLFSSNGHLGETGE